MNVYQKISEYTPSSLLESPEGAEKIGLSMALGQGEVKRGTVVMRDENGLFKAAEAADITAENFLAVLDETVNTDLDETVAQAAAAYTRGRFIKGRVLLKDGTSAQSAQEAVLRGQGIDLKYSVQTAPQQAQ